MSSAGISGISGILGSLLQLEENFSSCLARIDALVLKPLLQAEPQDPKEKEIFQLLVLLSDRFQSLWNFTEENSRILRGKSQLGNSGCIQDFYILWKGEVFLSLYIQYFVTFANFVVVQGFEQAARSKSDSWKLHKAVLKEFLRDFTSESSLGLALHLVLHKPFQEHVQGYLQLLSLLQEQIHQGSERDVVATVLQEFGKLESFISQVLDEAVLTKELWKSLGCKFTDVLCVPERRLLEDSRNLPIASGAARSERLLLFDDVLVLIQGNSFQSFDLKLVWVDENCGEKSAPGLHSLRITTPEETFVLSTKDPQMKAVWRWKLEQAVRQALHGKRDFPLWGRSGEGSEAPARRFFTYAFRMEGRLRGATYEGEWLWGKPHGKGTLKWRDGRNHVGDFQEGLEHGFGICLVPQRSEDRYDCYKCHWYQGKMRGYGICEYGNDLVYRGYFKDNQRQGFGILENFSAEHPFKYTGQWENDKKNGYGVWDDKERGERYIGMWSDDHRHGEGIVVTQSGLCYQRTFHGGKMVGSGILLLEDDSVYEGNFTEELTFVGKGKLSLANGFVLQGTFSSRGGRGLSTQGVLSTAPEPRRQLDQLGLKEFPVEKRWTGIFEQFQEFLRSGCKEETEESFTGFHIQTSKELRKSQEYLCCQRGSEENFWKIEEILEDLVEHQGPEALQSYLEKALESSLHPLGKLLRALTAAFQATFSGIGANRHLLAMAQDEALESSLHPLGKLLRALTAAFQATFSGIGANRHLLAMAQDEALESSLHPLGKLLRALTAAFQATFSGIGANRHLLAMAQDEALESSLHPLGKLLRALTAAFQATFSGIGANRHLLAMAQDEALESSLHPLGKLLRALTAAFQATFSGIGANRHLLAMAQDEALESSLHPLGKLLRALSAAFQATFSGIGANRHLLAMAQDEALESSLHPLGKLLRALTAAFQATFSGIGANRHLLAMAQDEVKFYSRKIWEFYQGLLRVALQRKGRAPAEDADPSLGKGPSLVLPLILPGFYPELSMLYMLQHQREDELYCQGIVELSLFPDIQLLEFLDVQKHLWPLKDLTLTSNQRRSLIKDKCFLSATECLQKLITTVDPREKLEILRRTYEELELTVSRLLDAEYRLPMDDLLPLLMFVVSRAKIQHLGAEIHLIRDLMDPTNQGGMLDFLLTALESCYQHIQRIRLHPKENSHSS